MNTDALGALSGKTSAKRKPAWRPPQPEDFHVPADGEMRWILAADPSLKSCGAVLLGALRDGFGAVRIGIRMAATFKTAPVEAGGHTENFARARELYQIFDSWLFNVWLKIEGPFEFVHEAPPTGGIIRNPESAQYAGLMLQLAMDRRSVPVQPMISPRTHKHFTCGKPNGTERKVTKTEHHATLMKVAADLGVQGLELLKNEGQRDAFSVALTQLHRPVPEAS
jgi:hypothetical protein